MGLGRSETTERSLVPRPPHKRIASIDFFLSPSFLTILCSYYSSCTAIESDATEGFSLMISSSFSILPRFLLLYEIVWILSHHLSPHFYLFQGLSPHLFHHFRLLGDLSHHLFHHFYLSVHFSGLCYTINMIFGLYMILATYCDFAAVGIRGNLSPPVLAKNKGTAVFRLVSAAGRG